MAETKKYSSVIDTPKKATDKDAFGMDKYKNGLISFIEKTNTPITIALQGEWGSGKTSLMNTLRKELCDDEGKRFHPIWINTWQFSLMKDANQTLISIIKGLTEEVIDLSKDRNSDNIKKLSTVFGKVFKASAKVALKATTGQDLDGVIDAFSPENKEVTVLQLRNALNDAINDIIKEGSKEAFIFFIDDLDRIDPPVAVEILELLKNIFDLENCVFVLAIDYDVIIKGLEPKFGKFTEKNEREFRSFFDKIIQLPFSMPVANYDIDNFLVENLEAINYLDNKQKDDDNFKTSISEVTRLSVGSNPRALKRLLNSLSLINSINIGLDDNTEDASNTNLDKLINFALVNIQIAYPQIYSLLVQYPDFIGWNDKIAIQMNLPSIDENIVEKLNAQEEFDEDWEKVLFRVCEKDFFLKKKALNISRLLNKIRNIIEDANENIEVIISSVISLSSVTSLEAFDTPNLNYHNSSFLKKIRYEIVELLQQDLPNVKIEILKRKVVTNAFFDIEPSRFRLTSTIRDGEIVFDIFNELWEEKDFEDRLKNKGLFEEYNELINNFKILSNNYDNIGTDFFSFIHKKNGYIMHFWINNKYKNIDNFLDKDNLKNLSSILKEYYHLNLKFRELIKKSK